jgi:hypothetical protein
MEAADLSETLVNNYLCTLHHILYALKMVAADFFETLLNIYLCTRRHILEALKI